MSRDWCDLADWLLSTYPDDLLMPVREGSKAPMFRHTDGAWSWSRYDRFVASHNIYRYNVAILLRTICVVDVDSHELVRDLEQRYPSLTECPSEITKKGKHYFFSRSALCDSMAYMDQRSGVIQSVDFKTRCSTGNAGVIVVAPSEHKTWVRTPWSMGDILPPIPDDVLQAVALPARRLASVTCTFPDGRSLTFANSPHLHKFDLISNVVGVGSDGHVSMPVLVGSLEDMQQLMAFCEKRRFTTWSVNVAAIRQLADYLCANHKVMRSLSSTDPISPAAWISSAATVSQGWASSMVCSDMVCISASSAPELTYAPLHKDERWLLQRSPCIKVTAGTQMLRPNMLEYARTALPPAVHQILARHGNVALAGSSALDIACPHILSAPSDYDFYMFGVEEAQALAIIQDIREMVGANVVAQTGAAVTMLVEDADDTDISIQIILRRYRDHRHILETFDFAPCQALYSGGEMWVTSAWLHSIEHMCLCVNFWKWNTASVSRIYKYYSKGFEVFVPALRRSMFRTDSEERVPGVRNLFDVEAAAEHRPLCYNPFKKQRSEPTRLSALEVRRLVRTHNYWGDRHQSGYSEYVGGSIQYVLRALTHKCMQWLGLRPVGALDPTASMSVPEATDDPFHTTSPNFSALYMLDA
jgi:hypothetical protein